MATVLVQSECLTAYHFVLLTRVFTAGLDGSGAGAGAGARSPALPPTNSHCSDQASPDPIALDVTMTLSKPIGLMLPKPCRIIVSTPLSGAVFPRSNTRSNEPELVTLTVMPLEPKDLFIRASSALGSPARAAAFRGSDMRLPLPFEVISLALHPTNFLQECFAVLQLNIAISLDTYLDKTSSLDQHFTNGQAPSISTPAPRSPPRTSVGTTG